VVNDLPSSRRDIAMVFQDFALYPHMTARKNMSFPLTIQRLSKQEIASRVASAAAMLGISDLLDVRPGSMSGGERQRVALGRAIVRQAGCLLLDEPLSNLDATLRHQMRGEIRQIHRGLGATSIHVTHDQEEAMSLGDRVAVMAEGRILQVAPPMELYRNPVNRFVAGFIGSPGMNFLDGRMARRGESLMFVSEGAGEVALSGASLREGEAAVLGIRPERLVAAGALGRDSIRLCGRVESVEPLGDRADLRVRLGNGTIMLARVDGAGAMAAGEQITLAASEESFHFFEPGPMGRAIAHGAARCDRGNAPLK
jgi:multiple sugar transport system ATP-binding protein